MRPWKTFYRLLGIPLHGRTPSHYQLLDLPPQHCTPQAVDDALAARKKQLRQSIPSPEFLAPIARFEREHLELAAAVLRDPARRAAYDRRLRRHHQLLQNHDTRSQRQSLVAQANQCLHAALNLDGTLDDHKRDALIDELTRIGLSPAQAQAVVKRLPKPSRRLTRLGTAHLQRLINQFLQLLTATCPKGQISRRQYIAFVAEAINMGLPAATAHQLLNAHQNRTSPPEPLAEADLFDELTPAAAELFSALVQPDLTQTARPSLISRHSRLLGALAVALLALLLALLFFTQPRPRPTVVNAPTVNTPGSEAPDVSRGATSDHPVAPQLAPPAPTVDSPSPEPTDLADQSPSDHPAPPRPSRLPGLDDFRRVYPGPHEPTDKFADLTLALLACAERAARFAGQPDAHPGVLASVLDSPHPTDELIAPVQFTPDRLRTTLASNTFAPDLPADLPSQLQHPDRPVRYRAIEELRLANSPQAARMLLDTLVAAPPPDGPTAARILDALQDITDPQIPVHLLRILAGTRRRPLAQLIVRTLLQANRMPDYSPRESDAALPYRYSAERLAACVDWWCRYYGLAADTLRTSQLPLPEAAAPAAAEAWPAVQPTNTRTLAPPQQTMLALTAAASEYARNTAACLHAFNWDADAFPPSPTPADPDTEPLAGLADLEKIPDLSQRLVASLAAVTDQCLGLIRRHPDAARLATQADLIELDRQNILAQADLPLQQALAETQAAADLLNLLLQLTDAAPLHPEALEDLSPPADGDLLDQLRYSAYCNLALWDLLARQDTLNPTTETPDAQPPTYHNGFLPRLGPTLTDNPLDIDALEQLRVLHRRQRDHRLGALYQFTAALDAYRTGLPYPLAHWDPNTADAAYARRFTEIFLSVPIENLLNDARRLAQAPLCADCGSTRRADCRSCRATGQVRCPTCRGRGSDPANARNRAQRRPGQPPWSLVDQPCPTCKGRGLVTCDRCAGRGSLPCQQCQAPPAPQLTPQLIGRIQNLNNAVDYLRAGGPDIYAAVGLADRPDGSHVNQK